MDNTELLKIIKENTIMPENNTKNEREPVQANLSQRQEDDLVSAAEQDIRRSLGMSIREFATLHAMGKLPNSHAVQTALESYSQIPEDRQNSLRS